MSTALAAARQRATNLARNVADAKSPVRAGMNAGVVLIGAAGAGALDGMVGELAGQRPSVAAGLGLAAIGFVMKSPTALYGAAGAIAPTVYDAAKDAASGG